MTSARLEARHAGQLLNQGKPWELPHVRCSIGPFEAHE